MNPSLLQMDALCPGYTSSVLGPVALHLVGAGIQVGQYEGLISHFILDSIEHELLAHASTTSRWQKSFREKHDKQHASLKLLPEAFCDTQSQCWLMRIGKACGQGKWREYKANGHKKKRATWAGAEVGSRSYSIPCPLSTERGLVLGFW